MINSKKVSIKEAEENLEFFIEEAINGKEILIYTEERNFIKLEPINEEAKEKLD